MQAKCIFSWTYFLAEITDVPWTGHMLGLNMVCQSLPSFISIRALQAYVFTFFTSDHLWWAHRGLLENQVISHNQHLISMESGLMNTKGIFGWTKLLTDITFITWTFHVLSFYMVSDSLSFICLVTTEFASKANIFHFNITVQIFFEDTRTHQHRHNET